MMGTDQDDIIVVPIGTARGRVLGSAESRQAARREHHLGQGGRGPGYEGGRGAGARAAAPAHRLQAEAERRLLAGATSPKSWPRRSLERVLALLLAAVASVSLVVGGIGNQMNIMLVSVTERTREIGCALAVGRAPATSSANSWSRRVTLSLLGGLVGIAIGVTRHRHRQFAAGDRPRPRVGDARGGVRLRDRRVSSASTRRARPPASTRSRRCASSRTGGAQRCHPPGACQTSHRVDALKHASLEIAREIRPGERAAVGARVRHLAPQCGIFRVPAPLHGIRQAGASSGSK